MRELVFTVGALVRPVWCVFAQVLRRVLHLLGLFAAVVIALACTRIPFDQHRWLGTAAGACSDDRELIVVLGGSGMPSGPEMRRLHEAATLATAWPEARVMVVHPGDTAVLGAMVAELVLRGVDPRRIDRLNEGDNTRAQALAVQRRMGKAQPALALVTAPENLYRSVRSFRKAGFNHVCGAPAWDHAMPHHFRYGHRAIGGRDWMPDVSGSTRLRYTFWNYLKLEIACLREYLAIGYYALNGWI